MEVPTPDRELRERIVQFSSYSSEDFVQIGKCRRSHNQLGYAYQLAFVRVMNRFPTQQPFEIVDELLTFAAVHAELAPELIHDYEQRRQTIAEHQLAIRRYLGLRSFEDEQAPVDKFLFDECCRLEQTAMLRIQVRQFLRDNGIVEPGISILDRVIGMQRQKARRYIFGRIADALDSTLRKTLDELLVTGDTRKSRLQELKEAPGAPSSGSMLRLSSRVETIRSTGILDLDLTWLNNNFQRSLAKQASKRSAHRLRELEAPHRYSALTCLLRQTYADSIDNIVEMQHKLLNRVCSQAQRDVDETLRQKRKTVQRSMAMFDTLGSILLDEGIEDQNVRQSVFGEVSKEELAAQIADAREFSNGRATHEFHGVVRRFTYLRKFTPSMLKQLTLHTQNGLGGPSAVLEGLQTLLTMNEEGKRVLPDDVTIEFVPTKLRPFVETNGSVDRQAWECALLLSIRDEIRSGNITVKDSKRFGDFDKFFIGNDEWERRRGDFFRRAGLPAAAAAAKQYLEARLNKAYDTFLASQPDNAFATIDENGWKLTTDHAEKLDDLEAAKLEAFKVWLGRNMRSIRLPDLLIEVDNELHFTDHFMSEARLNQRTSEDVCSVLVTLMAHGCNIGTYTMSRLTEGVSYAQIKRISDWHLTEDNQRAALASIVRAISSLGTSLAWGDGTTSSSDGQRYLFPRKVLQQTFSHRMNDFALEFYSFVADNYAPYYSTPIECTDRDAAYVLDGLLYNESDLALEEHYTDTHGYTEINFAAFAMLGRRFCPRIRGLKGQRIYRVNNDRDYGALKPLVTHNDRKIHFGVIENHWDRMGHFYASLESGHTTASVALKRLAGYSKKNHFYKANRELGRILKTEFILEYMSQPLLRRRVRKGLLKGEQLHALARDVCYGKQGRVTARDLQQQMNTCSCLTLILACIIYWQAKEIERVITHLKTDQAGVDPKMIEHISPIEWDNVIIYGEYVINRELIRAA